MTALRYLVLPTVFAFSVSCSHKVVKFEPTQVSVNKSEPVEVPTKTEIKIEEKKDNNLYSVNCNLGKDARSIYVQKEDKKCKVQYSKEGNTNQMAWGEKTPSICKDVFNNIKGNIEKGGFNCSEKQETAGL